MAFWRAIYRRVFGDCRDAGADGGVIVTTTPASVTLDFPLSPDYRRLADARAWRIFTLAIIFLVGSLLWFSICHVLQWQSIKGLSILWFILGILGLIAAVTSTSSARLISDRDDDLRQLAVVDNLLVRTARDQRKRVWYRQEIRAITVEDVVIDGNWETATSTRYMTFRAVHLVLELNDGEKVLLLARVIADPAGQAGVRAEVEEFAAQLRRPLFAAPGVEKETASHAIQAKVDSAADRYTQ
jgi:hypothetical protein